MEVMHFFLVGFISRFAMVDLGIIKRGGQYLKILETFTMGLSGLRREYRVKFFCGRRARRSSWQAR